MKYAPVVALIFAAILGVLLVTPLPFHGRAADAVGDLVHAPAFGVLSVLVLLACHRLGWRGTWVAIAVGAVVIAVGGLMEIVQGYVGRGPSWGDFWADAFGVSACLLIVAPAIANYTATAAPSIVRTRLRWSLAGLLLVLAQLPATVVLFDCWQQWTAMPEIASFERPLEMSRWRGLDCRLRRIDHDATDGHWALEATLLPGVYPGVEMQFPPADWTGHTELVFDVRLDNGPPLAVVLKIHDRQHWYNGLDPSDRFERHLELQPGLQQIRVQLDDVETAPHDRRMNLCEIGFVQLYTVHLQHSRTLILDHVQLR